NQCNNYYLYIEECKHRMLFSLIFYLFCCIISVIVFDGRALKPAQGKAVWRPIVRFLYFFL
ncbi:MAG: hypothetical protein KJ791_01175, partial [Nanoarchaeota archaeon]|nr:hypothetical protein [Nanoarchaeota archaeon]